MKLFIVGYMASGKTTFGKALADKLNAPFIDLDDYIESHTGHTIKEIFETQGEEGFRKTERELLLKAMHENANFVMACGGGTPCYFDNMEAMNNSGITIFLEASTPVLIQRLQLQNDARPLMSGKSDDEIEEKVLTQLCQRLPHYMEAKLKWHGDDLENEQQINSNVEEFVSSYPSLFRF